MIRMSKFADYGIVLMTYIADASDTHPQNARGLAVASSLPLPTVSKILKSLSRAGLLLSHRGKQGGYTLARSAREISVVDMIGAIDGPIAMTECSTTSPSSSCELEGSCPVRSNWQLISSTVHRALGELTLADMTRPMPAASELTHLRGTSMVAASALRGAHS
jgi:FeS assembly SUF system regulator